MSPSENSPDHTLISRDVSEGWLVFSGGGFVRKSAESSWQQPVTPVSSRLSNSSFTPRHVDLGGWGQSRLPPITVTKGRAPERCGIFFSPRDGQLLGDVRLESSHLHDRR